MKYLQFMGLENLSNIHIDDSIEAVYLKYYGKSNEISNLFSMINEILTIYGLGKLK